MILRIAVLNRRELRQPQQEVGEIETRPLNRRALARRCRARAGERETAARILIRLQVGLNPPEVASPPHGVAAAIPDDPVLDLKCLVASQ